MLGLAQAVQSDWATVKTPAVADLRPDNGCGANTASGVTGSMEKRTWLRRRCYREYEVRDGVVVKIEHLICRRSLPLRAVGALPDAPRVPDARVGITHHLQAFPQPTMTCTRQGTGERCFRSGWTEPGPPQVY